MTPPELPPPGKIEEIIIQFLEGNATNDDILVLQQWLNEAEVNRKYFDEVNTTFQASITLNRINSQKTDEAWHELSHSLGSSRNRQISWIGWSLRIAASLMFLAAVGYAISAFVDRAPVPMHGSLVKNSTGRNTRIVLSDSSIVYLNTNSILEYPPSFGTTSREVTLKGEAFFEVKKGSKPFIVRTDNMTIKVKGTRFNVQAYKTETDVKATLEEGSIELTVPGESRVYSLTPGDQVILQTDQHKITRKKVDPSRFTAWKEDVLTFDNIPLIEVVYKIENRYHVNIEVDKALIEQERLTMTIGNESLDEVLELIQLSSGLKSRREINDIILYQ